MGSLRITDKGIPLDSSLVQKLDLMIKRVEQEKPKLDNLTVIEGPEGVGKTTMSTLVGYYVHYKTGRPFSEKNVFADTKEAINFSQNTEKQIIIFDEPALDVLNAEWWKETQKDLIKLLMLSRKKRHFFIFNITKFYKFSEYLVVDRASCMIHLYEQVNKNQPAFCYIGKTLLENLYNDFRKKRERNYKKYKLFTGTFPDVLDLKKSYNILNHFNLDEYERKKDIAIQSIGKKFKNDVKDLKKKIGSLKFPIQTKKEYAEKIGIPLRTIQSWLEEESIIKVSKEIPATQASNYLSILVENGRKKTKAPELMEQ